MKIKISFLILKLQSAVCDHLAETAHSPQKAYHQTIDIQIMRAKLFQRPHIIKQLKESQTVI